MQPSHYNQRGLWECVSMENPGSHGNLMKTKCLQGIVEPEVQTLCQTDANKDFLRGMPVVDELTGVVYRNVFCARCNAVQNVSYWRMKADCGIIPASALLQDNELLLAFIRENCSVKYQPTYEQRKYLKNCIPTEGNCSSKQIVNKEPVVQELCSYYSFPICGDADRKNPHCALCNGEDITQVNCTCFPPVKATLPMSTTAGEPTMPSTTSKSTTPPHTYFSPGTSSPPDTTTFSRSAPPPETATPGTAHPPHSMSSGATSAPMTTRPPTGHWGPPWRPPPPPPLSILFDFSSNEISIHGKTTQTKVLTQNTCQEGFVYDPFIQKCREAFRKVIVNSNASIQLTNSSIDVRVMLNCSSIQLNSSNTVLLPNGTLWVPLYATGYSRADYFMNGSNVLLCTNFASEYSKKEIIAKRSYVVSPLQIITYTGCSVSVLSLLVLLVVYCAFKELRTTPGKNLINLSLAMIFYHIFLFVAGLRNIQPLCTGIAIILHYFLLCSFAWMGVMAFDVAKTFVFQGKKSSHVM